MAGTKIRTNFHSIHPKRYRARQDWNKYNLFNLSRLQKTSNAYQTYFQQKWKAKSVTRGYHARQVREGQWERMFDRRTPAVVPVSASYLALNDGSAYAAGRGSGLETDNGQDKSRPIQTPYMQMVYHPTERRLDTAIFRALFASSAYQARQFVVHGHVKVNGQQMRHPGYLLNPGDMFQVDPDRVHWATGAVKMKRTKYANPNSTRTRLRALVADGKLALPGQSAFQKANVPSSGLPDEVIDHEDDEEEFDEDEDAEDEDEKDILAEEEEEVTEDDPHKAIKQSLKELRARIKDFLESPPNGVRIPGKRKRELRALLKTVRSTMSRAASASPSSVEDLEVQFLTVSNHVANRNKPDTSNKAATLPEPAEEVPASPEPQEATADSGMEVEPGDKLPDNFVFPEEFKGLTGRQLMETVKHQWKATHHTPWQSRPYMSPFAFIPRYLEVNQAICSAVYLRHPVVKPGLAEVPTPFAPETSQLAFNWYLRRR